ncbi:MAG: zinc-binding dehydrogenase, partial [Kiritimatiellaceae bacterium]|nr:zinc-binding dehydrogenase [Kiritimatiellaceae bacterium]
QLGATAINYKTEPVDQYVAQYTQGAGFDVVFDSVGGANMLNSFKAAALNGHVVSTVARCEIDLTLVHNKGLSLHVVFMLIPVLHNIRREEHAHILRSLTQIVEAGRLKPVLDENRYSLDQVNAAHARLESGLGMGKVVIEQ